MIVRLVAKLIALLNSNRRAVEIGAAVAFGLWLALLPSVNLIFIALALVLFTVKVNLGMAIISFFVLSLVTPLLDPALDVLGFWLLTPQALVGFYSRLYALPVVPFTRFNDTLVAGGFVAGALLFVPVTLLADHLVRQYREVVYARIADSRLVKAFTVTPVFQRVARAYRQVERIWPTS